MILHPSWTLVWIVKLASIVQISQIHGKFFTNFYTRTWDDQVKILNYLVSNLLHPQVLAPGSDLSTCFPSSPPLPMLLNKGINESAMIFSLLFKKSRIHQKQLQTIAKINQKYPTFIIYRAHECNVLWHFWNYVTKLVGFLIFWNAGWKFWKVTLLISDQLIFFCLLQISRFEIHPHVNCVNSFQNSGNFEFWFKI